MSSLRPAASRLASVRPMNSLESEKDISRGCSDRLDPLAFRLVVPAKATRKPGRRAATLTPRRADGAAASQTPPYAARILPQLLCFLRASTVRGPRLARTDASVPSQARYVRTDG